MKNLWSEEAVERLLSASPEIGEDLVLRTYASRLIGSEPALVLHGGGAEDYRETGLVFQIDDIDAACHEVEVGGGRVVIAPREGGGQGVMLANVADTEGNGFTFSQNS